MKRLLVALLLAFPIALFAGEVTVTSVTAQQRYPWNGLVDIVVTLEGSSNDVAKTKCVFTSTNSATGAAYPVTSIFQKGSDAGSTTIWTRQFTWDAATDIGEVKVDDLVFAVGVEVLLGGVQLWEDGPYWAECNVGAMEPEEYGYYFWWGDTVGYKRNTKNDGWVSVKDGVSFDFCSENCLTYGKSVAQLQSLGCVDMYGKLTSRFDAATVHCGMLWRMPTNEELALLESNCTTTYTTRNGVEGRLVTGKGDFISRSVFLPSAGTGGGLNIFNLGSNAQYWSSTSADEPFAWCLFFYSWDLYRTPTYRYEGLCVRPVRESAYVSVTTRLKLDCRTGVRTCSEDGEALRYDASWFKNGERVRITDNGTIVKEGVSGVYVWHPDLGCSLPHLLKIEVLSGGEVLSRESAQFALGYIRNVTARQLWPHNKVALSFTVAADIGEVKDTNEVLSVWCARGIVTNVATRIIGDRSAKTGTHQIIWDMEADGLRIVSPEIVVGVSVEEISVGGVQLWEGGPYWAECNVGATKPEDYGYYFWWGDTVGYKRNDANNGWVSLKDGAAFSFNSENCPTYSMDNSALQSAGYIDSSGNLVAAHDAATEHLGAPWRMPTDAEFSALISNCDTTWTTRGGVYGRLITGRGAYVTKSIFFPAAGYVDGSWFGGAGWGGCYWSATPHWYYSNDAWYLSFHSDSFYKTNIGHYRYFGQSVRPVRGCSK